MDREKLRYNSKNIKTKASLNKARVETQIMREELETGLKVLDQIKKQRDYIIAQVKQELREQKDLQAKIEYLQKEYKLLQMSQAANERILKNTQTQRQQLTKEVDELETTVRALKGRNKNMLVQNDFGRLIEVMNLAGSDHQKEKSVLLTCLRDLIKTTEENEFEGVYWKAKYANAKNSMGARIRFADLSMGHTDLKRIYAPVIQELAAKFKKYNLRLETKTQTKQGVVVAVDVTLKLPYANVTASASSSQQLEV